MRIFVAGLLTETNTFAPAPTGMRAFEEMGIRRGDGSGESPAFAPAIALLEDLAAVEGHSIIQGLLAIAQPSGTVLRPVYESLRDELLQGLVKNGPIDAVILLLHGAMVADGFDDCEGDLLERARALVGGQVAIGVELDLHCHLSQRMLEHANVLVAYKEYPHTDVLDRLREVWRLTVDTALGRIRPTSASFDCRMTGVWHTTQEPVRSFVDHLRAVECERGVLSANFAHGFPWGDVKDAGAKVWVTTDGNAERASELSQELGRRVWAIRDAGRGRQVPLEVAQKRLSELPAAARPLVIADTTDNPGGGASGDSTFVLRGLLDLRSRDVVMGGFWDPMAARACEEAGVGAVLELRVGGKCGPASGAPVDVRVTVQAVRRDHWQTSLDGARQDCGLSAWVRTDCDVDLVLISRRQQVLSTDLFTNLGIDVRTRRGIVVKSSQHFHASFTPIASDVLYVHTPGLLRSDFEQIPYLHRNLDYWPRVAAPADRRAATPNARDGGAPA